jgi:hypothetical protein
MSETLILSVVFLALLALEWWRWGRRGWRILRIGTVLLAVAVMWWYQPNLYSALRGTLSMPPTKRDTTLFGRRPLSEYESGAVTMFQVSSAAARRMAPPHDVAFGALIWLALSPTLRRLAQGPREEHRAAVDGANESTPRGQA